MNVVFGGIKKAALYLLITESIEPETITTHR